MRISDWSSDVCSSDLACGVAAQSAAPAFHCTSSDPRTVLPEACAANSRSIKATSGFMATLRGDRTFLHLVSGTMRFRSDFWHPATGKGQARYPSLMRRSGAGLGNKAGREKVVTY